MHPLSGEGGLGSLVGRGVEAIRAGAASRNGGGAASRDSTMLRPPAQEWRRLRLETTFLSLLFLLFI